MLQEPELSAEADSENNLGGSLETMLPIGKTAGGAAHNLIFTVAEVFRPQHVYLPYRRNLPSPEKKMDSAATSLGGNRLGMASALQVVYRPG